MSEPSQLATGFDWVAPISTLVGAILGGGLAVYGGYRAQRLAAKLEREADEIEKETRNCASATKVYLLIIENGNILFHSRKYINSEISTSRAVLADTAPLHARVRPHPTRSFQIKEASIEDLYFLVGDNDELLSVILERQTAIKHLESGLDVYNMKYSEMREQRASSASKVVWSDDGTATFELNKEDSAALRLLESELDDLISWLHSEYEKQCSTYNEFIRLYFETCSNIFGVRFKPKFQMMTEQSRWPTVSSGSQHDV